MDLPIVDRMAVIFHGIVGGTEGRNGLGQPSNIADCAKTIKHNILSQYDCDIFTHSWSIEHKDSIESIYTPKKSLFQPQEYFGFPKNQITDSVDIGQAYRTISRYTSIERAMQLKEQYEKENGFKYKWVIILRYDLVFFTKLNLSVLDPNVFYVCSEPHWVRFNINTKLHDIVFLSGGDLMGQYCSILEEFKNNKYNPGDTHESAYLKAISIVNGDRNRIAYGFHRYKDVEIYRTVIKPGLNPVGYDYGALETLSKFENLLKELK